jgi:threonylcarbamoyladenosine tRNA methylthiotransferase MtaB
LGCKVNQCESAALEGLLQDAGYRKAGSGNGSELVVINTCTVTGKAAMQSRQAVRQAIRNYPGARIVVTGCYAQTAPGEFQSIPEVDFIVGHGDKLDIVQILDGVKAEEKPPVVVRQAIEKIRTFSPLPSVAPNNRTRAFLKIQDGCNAFCTYCIVPHARGRSRSMPLEDVLTHFRKLAAKGFQEVVLTGIHIGAYGKDLAPRKSLSDLLGAVSAERIIPRIRISSIEPTEVDAAIIACMQAPASVVCPHFHIPLQSGDDGILKRMGRTYTRGQFADLIHDIRDGFPFAAIGVDILAGFPGEDDNAFRQTHDLIRDLPVTYLHVFPFSPRKGTPAATYGGQVPQRIVKERCRRLRQLGEEIRAQFARANVGRTVHVLIETAADSVSGCPKGTSENYLTVTAVGADLKKNTIVPVCIDEAHADGSVRGQVVGNPTGS